MLVVHHFGNVTPGTQLEQVLQVLYLPYFFYQHNLVLNLVQVVDDVLLGTDKAVAGKPQGLAHLQQDGSQLLVGSLTEKLPFFLQYQFLGLVNQVLDVDPAFVQILQLGNLDLVSRLVFEGIVYVLLQVHHVPDGDVTDFPERNLDVPQVAVLARHDFFLQVIVHQLVQVVDVLVDGRRIDFLVRLEQVLEEI